MNVGANGGRFDFDDGGTYCGGWNDGKAHGHGVCTGPKGQGEYSGAWQFGYEFSGIYLWPSGNSYEGQWMSGKRHGLGVEKKGKWVYKGEWTQGFKGRYGIRISEISGARYEGTWANGLQDGYGVEIYADGGIYHGQIQQGLRHGYGIRRSVPYGLASRYRMKEIRDSLTSLRSEEDDERTQRERDKRMDENRGGFVLRARSEPYDLTATRSASQGPRRGSLSNSAERRSSLRKTLMSKLRKQKSTSDIEDMSITKKTSSFRSTASSTSGDSKHSVKVTNIMSSRGHALNSTNTLDDGDQSFISQEDVLDSNVVETYMGEWKSDKRTGFGIAERSDGLKYEGEWFNNKKNGYGVTTFRDGTKEEGKYKNNILVTDVRKPSKLLLLRTSKMRDKIDAALNNAMKAATTAQQKAEIAMARANNARSKAHSAEIYAKQARADSIEARTSARAAAPDFRQPGEEKPQPFITLDIDRQVEGKIITSTQLPIGSPNGRLPMSSNYQPNAALPMPSYLAQTPANNHLLASQPFSLDGGVYQGQTPATQPSSTPNQWNPTNPKPMGPSSSSSASRAVSGMNQQNPEYYLSNNYPPKPASSMPYNDNNTNNMLDSRPGISVGQQAYAPYGNQISNPGDLSTPRNPSNEPDLTNMMMSRNNPAQFVSNPLGVGPRTGSTRPTITRSTRITGSNDDLLHDPASSMHSTQTKSSSPAFSATSNSQTRPRLVHGAPNSANSSGHDSGLSSGGTSFDPDQHPIYNLGNPNTSHQTRSNTPNVDAYEVPIPVPIPKRKSLPSIVKTVPNHYKVDETARSNDQLAANETFIIENGIRKRVTAQPAAFTESGSLIPEASVMTSSSGSPVLARRVLLESVTKLDPSNPTTSSTTGGTKRGSMPTLVNIARNRQVAPSISREEASMLGSRRREELRRQRDFDSTVIGRVKALLQSKLPAMPGSTMTSDMHAYTQEIAIQTDTHRHTYHPMQSLKNVVYRNRVFIAIFFLNLSLALWFIQLLR